MSVIINPRGPSGAGKTELARRIMALYGGGRGDHAEPIYRPGRARPICYRFRHPLGGRPLAVLGHYEVTSGGCDTISGVAEVFRLAGDFASSGHDVLFEGLMVSRDYARTVAFARTHALHVLHLGTPVDCCIRNLIARRRAGRAAQPRIARQTLADCREIAEVCSALRAHARVETVSFDDAFARARELLGLLPRPMPTR